MAHLLEQAIEDNLIVENDIAIRLDKALYLLQKIDAIFLRHINKYGSSWTLEINSLSLILNNITPPFQRMQNLADLSTILARLHTLNKNLVALHQIDLPTEVQIALPQFQSLCPPPEYTDSATFLNNNSNLLEPAPLHLAAPPPYAEHPLTTTPSH